MGALALIGTAASLIGSAVSASGTLSSAKATRNAYYSEAAQEEKTGKEEAATAQREGFEEERKKNLALSTLQAGSAASGFSATDPTTLNLAGDISEYGTYKQQVAVAGGQAKKEARYATAATKRTTGDAVVKAAKYSALGTILGGVSSLAKYG